MPKWIRLGKGEAVDRDSLIYYRLFADDEYQQVRFLYRIKGDHETQDMREAWWDYNQPIARDYRRRVHQLLPVTIFLFEQREQAFDLDEHVRELLLHVDKIYVCEEEQ